MFESIESFCMYVATRYVDALINGADARRVMRLISTASKLFNVSCVELHDRCVSMIDDVI